ncbi:acetyltransferase [Cohnella soli]|uniref:Acetyltransferase n=1 Tax=Cohnella soli TaxID=425005 RepID=A0ABW0HL89_9BACL
MLPVILIGGGGHAKVCMDVLSLLNIQVLGYVTPDAAPPSLPFVRIGDDEAVLHYPASSIALVNGIGFHPEHERRKKAYSTFKDKGYSFLSIVHPSAVVAEGVHLSEGVQIMAGAILQPGTHIEENTIVNTRASVDHDCRIGPHVHLAPGSLLCGGVTVQQDAYIGAGATIIQGIRIHEKSLIGAGSVVVREVRPHTKVYGVPAREVTK